jgi:hypothetical protein
LWVGVLTGVTALAASYLTARGASKAALAQARTTALSDAVREQRQRRRSTYRDMLTCVHAFSEVCWRITDVDTTPDRGTQTNLLAQIHDRMGPTLADLTRATHEVLLDGPADVAIAAETLRTSALGVQQRLRELTHDHGPEQRRTYDAAYQDFRSSHVTFIELARRALEVASESR